MKFEDVLNILKREITTATQSRRFEHSVSLSDDELRELLQNYSKLTEDEIKSASNGSLSVLVDDFFRSYLFEESLVEVTYSDVDGNLRTITSDPPYADKENFLLSFNDDEVEAIFKTAHEQSELSIKRLDFTDVTSDMISNLHDVIKESIEKSKDIFPQNPKYETFDALTELKMRMKYSNVETVPLLKAYICVDADFMHNYDDSVLLNLQPCDKDGKPFDLGDDLEWQLVYNHARRSLFDVYSEAEAIWERIIKNREYDPQETFATARAAVEAFKAQRIDALTTEEIDNAVYAIERIAASEAQLDRLPDKDNMDALRSILEQHNKDAGFYLDYRELCVGLIERGEQLIDNCDWDEVESENHKMLLIDNFRRLGMIDDNGGQKPVTFDTIVQAFNGGELTFDPIKFEENETEKDMYQHAARRIKEAIDQSKLLSLTRTFDESTYLRAYAVINYDAIKDGKEPSRGSIKEYEDAKEWARALFEGLDKEKTAVKAVRNKDNERTM